MTPLLDARAVGLLLGLSARAVYDIPEHALPRYRLGAGRGALRFAPADVEIYLAASYCRGSPQQLKPDARMVIPRPPLPSCSQAAGNAMVSRVRKARPYSGN